MITSYRQVLKLSFLSGVLLTLSFPNFHLGFLGWVALVPFFKAMQEAADRRQALAGMLMTGLIFFGASLAWLRFVSVFGWIFVACLETAFFLIFGWACYADRGQSRRAVWVLWVASAWTAVEILRAEVPVFGLGWNLLAYSQSGHDRIRQFAALFGAYGLGFVMAAFNAVVFLLLQEWQKLGGGKWRYVFGRIVAPPPAWFKTNAVSLSAGALILAGLLAAGQLGLSWPAATVKPVRIASIQGNIAQELKWAPAAKSRILEIYAKLSELASYEDPDLIVWPEAAFPGYFNRDLAGVDIQGLAAKIQVPLVIGAPHIEDNYDAYNSAYLISAKGRIDQRYDKQYLVPFGEYVPLKPIFGWLESLARSLGISDFRAGKEPVIFSLEGRDLKFSTLICFEDVFSLLARRFVDHGAELLLVMTNDAWFGRSSAPYQHLQASVFRAVENGVPVVRSANTGVSAFIDEKGEVLGRVQNESGQDIFVTGRKTLMVPVRPRKTPYRYGGWAVPYVTLGVLLFGILPMKRSKMYGIRNKKRKRK